MKLFPVLTVEPEATIADFDKQHPDGADYVIVPAMSRDDDPVALQWIKSQAAKGAVIIGVCVGAKVVGNTGLLDGKRATTHWYSLKELRDRHPTIHYVADRRLVVDRGVATTTGITASMPMSLTLIEAIAGRDKAEAVGRDLGLTGWDTRHDSGAFQFTRPFALTVMGNTLAFWNREQLGIELAPGIDEVSLALVADAWSRTYRSRAVTFAGTAGALPTRSGLRILPAAGRHRLARGATAARRSERCHRQKHWIRRCSPSKPATELSTADVVAMQLEYPRHGATEAGSGTFADRPISIQILRANNAVFMSRAAPRSPITPARSHFARNNKSANTTNRGNETRLNRLIDTKPAGPPLSVRYGNNNTPMANNVQEERSRNQPTAIRTINSSVNQLSCPHGFQSLRIIRVKGSNLSAATNLAAKVVSRWKAACPSANTNGSPNWLQR